MQLKLSILLLFICFGTSLLATTYRINNTPGTDPDFDNLLDAHTIARNGDTLLIEGSNNSYGDLIVTKRLVIIGPGYFLDENPNTAVSRSAMVRRITLDLTITNDPNSGAAGSQIYGLDFVRSFGEVNVNVNNAIIAKCQLYEATIKGSNTNSTPAIGVYFMQNYFASDINETPINSTLTNIQLVNNIFAWQIYLPEGSSGAILHNLFLNYLSLPNFVGEIRSNIATYDRGEFVLPVLPNNQISHNIAAEGQFGDANNNFATVIDNLFLGEDDNSTDGQWQLKPNTIAANSAHDGTDRGPFGGSMPYVLSGQGGSPAIIFFEAEPIGTASNRLKVRIRAKSSN